MKEQSYIILISISVLTLLSCREPVNQTYSHVKYQPAGALQLDPGVFLDADSMNALRLELGDVVDVFIDGKTFQANVYPYVYDEGTLGINRFTLEKLELESGEHIVHVAKAGKPTIPEQRLEMYGEPYFGDVNKWGHFVISAPHGDCDLFTGEIVQTITRDLGIPTSAFYHPRFTFLGHWYDANRPLGKAPREDGHWTIPERIWNTDIDSVYRSYEDIIRIAAEVHPGQPLDFLCSFHGHDLKMKDSNGKRINREVIEAYGSGFSQDEYRIIIKWFNELSAKYFDTVPLLVFGNLPEHQIYEINGQTFNFWYTGLGTRTYGTLRKTNAIRGLHMETPNSLRFNPEARAKTAQLLGEFFTRIHDEMILPLEERVDDGIDKRPKNRKILLPAAEFRYRGRDVKTGAFSISSTEVTVGEFVKFINAKLGTGEYHVEKDARRIVDAEDQLICHFDAHKPGDMLKYEKGIFSVAANRDYYPMTNLSWFAATDYAAFVGGRLPTETEWVRAAGFWADSMHTYALESEEYLQLAKHINFDGSMDTYEGKTYPQTFPSGSLKPNGNGLYEMSGNVWEWCSDWYYSKYFTNLPKDEITEGPQGAESGTMRTFKGGSWGTGLDVTKVRYRVALAPELALADLGFRVVWEL